jgi:DNA polymerase sigma
MQQLLPSEDTEEKRRLFIDKLSSVLRREFPGGYTEVHVFGSSENRLGTNHSDGTLTRPNLQ